MNKAQTFQEFLVNETTRIALLPFLMNLAGATLLARLNMRRQPPHLLLPVPPDP